MKKEYFLKDDGFRAIWFEGKEKRDKAVIYMNGAGMGEKITVEISQYLRDAGYSVLCLGFYKWKGMPKEMYRIPVEYIEKAYEKAIYILGARITAKLKKLVKAVYSAKKELS